MWTASHDANAPSEDRHSSLVNVLLRPQSPKRQDQNDGGTSEQEYRFPKGSCSSSALIRLSLWAVFDGHGGGCVASYVSEVLLPHIVANVSEALNCVIVHRGVCNINGEPRDANARDFHRLIRDSGGNSERLYRSPNDDLSLEIPTDQTAQSETKTDSPQPRCSLLVGTHSPAEIADITQAITSSFLAVDEGWINAVDPMKTQQTSCINNGAWNAGACALVLMTLQRLDSAPVDLAADPSPLALGGDPPHTPRDVYSRNISNSSSSTSANTDPHFNNASQDSETTLEEILDQDRIQDFAFSNASSCLSTCHHYRPHQAMLYTAHVGDCRAILLGAHPTLNGALPKHPHNEILADGNAKDATSDENNSIGSSDDESDDADDFKDMELPSVVSSVLSPSAYMSRPPKRHCRRERTTEQLFYPPFTPLPPFISRKSSDESDDSSLFSDPDVSHQNVAPLKCNSQGEGGFQPKQRRQARKRYGSFPLSPLPGFMRTVGLTADHSAYNPTEVVAVLRRCNNAPQAISSMTVGGIKRVAGSLTVTRALGDAYLKTPSLSFSPYKSHAPYITAHPEVTSRLLRQNEDELHDRILVLASDGIWERCNVSDVLKWTRDWYEEKTAPRDPNEIAPKFERGTDKRSKKRSRRVVGKGMSNVEERHSSFISNEGKDEENDRNGQGSSSTLRYFSERTNQQHNAKDSEKIRGHERKRRRPLTTCPTPADAILRQVLKKVRRSHGMSSVRKLLSLPKGRTRRVKHDDMTVVVVDMVGFVT